MTGVDARVSVDLSLSCQKTETMSHKEEEEIKRILSGAHPDFMLFELV